MDVLLWIGRLKLVKLRSMVGFRFHSEAKLLDHNTNTTTHRSSIRVFSVLLSGFGCSSSRITRSLENCDHLIEWFWGTVALGKYWVQSSKHSPESMFSLIYLFFFFFFYSTRMCLARSWKFWIFQSQISRKWSWLLVDLFKLWHAEVERIITWHYWCSWGKRLTSMRERKWLTCLSLIRWDMDSMMVQIALIMLFMIFLRVNIKKRVGIFFISSILFWTDFPLWSDVLYWE